MPRLRALLGALTLALVAVALACSGSSGSAGIPPTTGIVIRAETLTTGRGCGREPTQLFKYAAVVFGYSGGDPAARESYGVPVTAGVYDCFADGTFIELPEINRSVTFRLEVFGFTEQAYLAAGGSVEAAGTDASALRDAGPTWTTTCFATQQRDVQSLAVCEPLAPTSAETRVVLRTGAFTRKDGRVTSCARAADAGGGDAAAGDAGDASSDAGDDGAAPDASIDDGGAGDDASAGDAGAGGLSFSTVRVRASIGGAEIAPPTDLACPDAFVIPNAVPKAEYRIDVELLGSASEAVGKTTCTAVAAAGVETAATCAPVE